MINATRLFLAGLLGFITGCFSGAFGVGGAIFSTPAIRLILQEPAGIALGTTLPLAIPSAVTGGFNYWKQGLVDRRVVLIVGPVGAAASAGGAYVTRYLGLDWLMLITALLILYTAGRTMAKAMVTGEEPAGKTVPPVRRPAPASWRLVLIGLGAGLLSGLLGVGGGVIMVPAFLLWLDMEVKEAMGTSLVSIAFLAIPGTVVHSLLGHVDWALCGAMALGALPGSWLGSRFTLRSQSRLVLTLFSFLLALTGIMFMVNELRTIF